MKIKYNKRIALTVAFNLFVISILFSQENTTNYVSTSAEIANPERGWYDDYYSHSTGSTMSSNFKPLKASELISNRENDNITLILRLFYLHEFLEENTVSEEYLSRIQNDFDSIRLAGVKCIVRFAYSSSQSAAVWDATPDKVFSHIESLRTVLSENSDIIAGVQAGFIGAWGEWYYTKNFAGTSYVPDATDQENRRLLVEALLDILPQNLVVQMRTPAIMKNIVQTTDPILEEEAFDGSIKTRVGHHNDCFLADNSDYGTYTNLTNDLAYLHESTKYTITGGETCDASNTTSDCLNSVPRMEELHWTYLNRDYNKLVYAKWEEQGCYEEVNLSLGYRIHLKTATLSDTVSQGGDLNFSFVLENTGFAAPTQYKPIQIVLTHIVSEEQTILNYAGVNDDIRFWLPGEIQLNGSFTIPETTVDGNYYLSLRFPDKDSELSLNPAYSIQLANPGIWDEVNGYNTLNQIITIGLGGIGQLPEVPENLNAEVLSKTEISLTWSTLGEGALGYELMRSENDENMWTKIAETDNNSTSFTDTELYHGTTYNYIIRAKNQYGYSAWSEKVSVTTLGVNVDKINKEEFLIYPNPLNGSDLVIKFQNQVQKKVSICNIAGKLIYQNLISQEELRLNSGMFSPGMYVISIQQDDENVSKKFLVQ